MPYRSKDVAVRPFGIRRLKVFFWSIFCFFFKQTCLTTRPARFGTVLTGRISLDVRLNRHLSVFLQTRFPSYISLRLDSNCRKLSPWFLYMLRMVASFCRCSVSLISSLGTTGSWFFVYWSLSTIGWCWTSLMLSNYGASKMYTEGSFNLLCMIGKAGRGSVAIRSFFAREARAVDD